MYDLLDPQGIGYVSAASMGNELKAHAPVPMLSTDDVAAMIGALQTGADGLAHRTRSIATLNKLLPARTPTA